MMHSILPLFTKISLDFNRLMAMMLLSLHALLLWADNSYMFGALLLCHYGVFLLWQPVMHQSNKVSPIKAVLIVIFAGIATFAMNWWFAAFWMAGLFSFIGGRIVANDRKSSGLANILAAIYLLTMLLLWVVPKLIGSNDDLAAAEIFITYLLPLLPLSILFFSIQNTSPQPTQNLDFFYTLLIFLLTLIVILGSFAIGILWKINYLELLVYTAMGLSATLVALSWLWNPSATFSGLELLMSRYLLSVGMPFEIWVKKIANYAEQETSAKEFLQKSVQALSDFTWVSGVAYAVENQQQQQIGRTTPFVSSYHFHQLKITVYSHWQFTPAMYLHVQLMTQVLGEFYEAKCREEAISQNAYMQSLYETGSRLTHDIKNILQSLGSLSSIAEQSRQDSDHEKLVQLFKKQLPRLNQRLTSTLNKLEQPSVERRMREKVSDWWKNFKTLNAHQLIQFDAPANLPKANIDPDVLDSVIDNLLQNALEKAKLENDVTITVAIIPSDQLCIEVTDTGSAIPSSIVEKLFASHVSSKNGLGVGLYHAAKQAQQAGYALNLVSNHDGEVRFRLGMVAE